MGEVYRARDPRLGREVAIKILPISFSDDADRLRRFEQEARAAGVLNHPNIIAVYDVGSDNGIPYVVSELLEGETLRAFLADDLLSVRKSLDYALQTAQGLAAAHDKGIVHRDLKPENLFVTNDGRVKILDFGLAKLVRPETTTAPLTEAPTAAAATEPGVVLGTLDYMAPEQARGRPADIRSDIFAFGAILYEMLSGQRAFHRNSSADTMSAILKEDPPNLSTASRGIPPALDRVVRHCLEKNPEQRFQSAHDLAFTLAAAAEPAPAPSTASRRAALRWVGVGLAVLALVAGALLLRARRGAAGAPGAPVADRKSIAVLPFQNLSPDAENAYFADGMTEDILTQLAKIRDLKVISRTSVMRYKGTQKPIKEIAGELGVAAVLEGSVRRAGDRVRIVGQLVDAKSDEHLWAETYDRDLKDVFAIQSDVAKQIAAALRATLSPKEKKRIDQSSTRNLAAYDLYLKGRELYNHYRKADNESAIETFQKALELDPSFALAYAGLGDAYAQRAQRFGFPQSMLDSSLEMSRKAISLDPDLAEGYKALGVAYFSRGEYRESIELNRRAVEINPNLTPALANIGYSLWALGKPDEALPWMLRAIQLDPKSPPIRAGIGACYAMLRDFEKAAGWLKQTLELEPEFGQAHAFWIYQCLLERRDEEALREVQSAVTLLPTESRVTYAGAVAELLTGNLQPARQHFENLLTVFRGIRIASQTAGAGIESNLAYLEFRAGERKKGEAFLGESLEADRVAERSGNQNWGVPFDVACVHALKGEKDEAFRWLEKAVDAGWLGWPIGARSPLLDSLRTDPRFRHLEARLDALIRQVRRRAGLS